MCIYVYIYIRVVTRSLQKPVSLNSHREKLIVANNLSSILCSQLCLHYCLHSSFPAVNTGHLCFLTRLSSTSKFKVRFDSRQGQVIFSLPKRPDRLRGSTRCYSPGTERKGLIMSEAPTTCPHGIDRHNFTLLYFLYPTIYISVFFWCYINGSKEAKRQLLHNIETCNKSIFQETW